MAEAFAGERGFWTASARAAVVGAASGVVTLMFLQVEDLLHALLWPGGPATTWFATPPLSAVVVLVLALAVGLARRATGITPPDPNFLDELVAGRSEPRHSAQLVGIGLLSLVGGASIGPEASIATAGAGLGTAVADRAGGDDTLVHTLTFAGISGVFGGLLTFAFATPLIGLELQQDRQLGRYERLVPALIAATVSLAVVYPVIGAPFVGLYDLAVGTGTVWHLLAAVPLGLLGAALGLAVGVTTALVGAVAGRLRDPVVRAVAGGAVLAALGLALPLTLFSGREELEIVLTEGVAALGVGFLLVTVVGKLLTFAVSMRAGFFGGALFPLLFIGAVVGALVGEAVPSLPVGLAVASVAGATTVSLLGLPLTTLVFVIVVFGLGAAAAAVPTVAIVTAYVAVQGTAAQARVARLLAARRRA